MLHRHQHTDDDGHDHHDHHGHHHHHGDPIEPAGHGPHWPRVAVRFGLAGLVVAGAVLAASSVIVGPGEAVVVTEFGNPLRVLTEPGLAWKLPLPIQGSIPVDLRLRTTTSGLQDVGTRDGLRILVQAYVAWQVDGTPDGIRQFLRAVRNDPDEAARHLRSFVGSALQVAAGTFDLADLVNTDPSRVKLAAFEDALAAQIAPMMRQTYGITVRQVGIERLSLPETTLAATVARMRTERETVAAQRTAEGLRQAAEIRSNATRDARIAIAEARTEAAGIEAAARKESAELHAKAYGGDPQLYMMLRSLDTLASIVGGNTRVVLRTDAAPFNTLVQGPALPPPGPAAAAVTGATPP